MKKMVAQLHRAKRLNGRTQETVWEKELNRELTADRNRCFPVNAGRKQRNIANHIMTMMRTTVHMEQTVIELPNKPLSHMVNKPPL